MIRFLQDYVAINTSYPNPDYQSVIALFKKHAVEDGFLVTQATLPSGNPVLVITLQGSSKELPALALNHHMDVVPADNPTEWTFPPFSGTLYENSIYARGTQDCKGLGVAQYAALKELKNKGSQPIRTIHLIIVPDEERGGFHGTKEFLDHPLFACLNIGYVLDEGMPSGNDTELLIKVDERTPVQVRVTSMGTQSHASGLLSHNCIHILNSFLSDVIKFHVAQQQRIGSVPAGNLISMHITSLITDTHVMNVIPSQAQATIDMRIPSHLSLDDGIALIDALVKKHETITYELVATSRERFKPIPLNLEFYHAVAQAISEHGITAKPFAFEATTDARFYSNKGIQALGLTPFTVTPNLHGTNEHIRIKDLEQGTAILSSFLYIFCTLIPQENR